MKHCGTPHHRLDWMLFFLPHLPRGAGPWGWASAIQYEQLVINTAALIDCPLDTIALVHINNPEDYPQTAVAPKWVIAQAWLREPPIEVTPTLQVVQIGR